MVCTRCNEDKAESDFIATRRTFRCKSCRLEVRRIYHQLNLEKHRIEKKAYRDSHPERMKAERKRWYETRGKEYFKEWKKKHPTGKKAHHAINRQINKGNFIKPSSCMFCPEKYIEAHHPDYSKPYYVFWLCPSHHQRLHRGTFELPLAA